MSTARTSMKLLPNDPGPLGLWKYPASPFPRQYVPLTLPLPGWNVATLTIPSPMTQAEWDALMACLTAMEPALVVAVPPHQSLEGEGL